LDPPKASAVVLRCMPLSLTVEPRQISNQLASML
jgi:hypothetical protein